MTSYHEMEYNGEMFIRRKFISAFWFLVKKDAMIDKDGISRDFSYQVNDEEFRKVLEMAFRQKKLERICK